MTSRDKAVARANGHCEAMVEVRPDVWTRCGKSNYEVHHAITRSRGGRVLDAVGEDYHLIVLCQEHHRLADGGAAYEQGLLLDGYVITENGKPVYYGTDEYLRGKYGLPESDPS